MPLKNIGAIEIPDSAGSSFDHGAFDPKTRRVFVAHTGRSRLEVIDHDAGKHIATLQGFPEAAGVVADDGIVLVTNRGAASLAWVDARQSGNQGRLQDRAPTEWGRDRVKTRLGDRGEHSVTTAKALSCTRSASTDSSSTRSTFPARHAGA